MIYEVHVTEIHVNFNFEIILFSSRIYNKSLTLTLLEFYNLYSGKPSIAFPLGSLKE